ncbi:MAG: prenyltransferase/squalene oxidase repeat-containing protein [Acetobacteraceae bacterium]
MTLPDDPVAVASAAIAASAQRATARLIASQDAAGRWEGEVVWCPVITAQVVLAHAIMARPVPPAHARRILQHFARTQRPDGGWGLHPESASYLFVTTLVYVAARLLGEQPGSPLLRDAETWLIRHEEGLGTLPTWGRFWLSLLGLYDRRHLTVCPPELFLLPAWLPLAADRLYCHTRYIYLGMAYLSGVGLRADPGSIGADLRRELARFTKPGPLPRHRIAATDLYVRPGRGLRLANDTMRTLGPIWHRLPFAASLRRRALARCLTRIRAEQRTSGFQALSPVNGILNTLALWANDPHDPDVTASLAGLDAWCWDDAAEGRRHAGARSTTWDTAFALQALAETTDVSAHEMAAMRSGYAALAALQVIGMPDGMDEGRQDPRGGWCFGAATHGWPVSDCTAEAISALVLCHRVPDLLQVAARIPPARLGAAFRFLLARQNADGGFATYERRRGGARLERLNPSEMFGDCMTERSYIECTASAIRALCHAPELPADALSDAEKAECEAAMARAVQFLLNRQGADGAWPGFWGINYVYATGFAVAALRDAGLPMEHPALRRAVGWLHAIQQPDGGWGEHFSGCLTGRYVANAGSLVITTSWALIALLRAGDTVTDPIRRGLDWLMSQQLPDGSWPQDSVNGVFFGTAMLEYRLYNTYFPTWAVRLADAAERSHGEHEGCNSIPARWPMRCTAVS